MMQTIFKELKTTLDSLESPFEDEKGAKIVPEYSKNIEIAMPEDKSGPQMVNLNEIDVSYDTAPEKT